MSSGLVCIRLSPEVERKLKVVSEDEDRDRSAVIREAIGIGLREKQVQKAVDFYSKGKATLAKAAKIAGISIWRMSDELAARKITAQYGKRELEEDLQALPE